MFTTEAEAWEAIADTLEMIEGMPEWDDGEPTFGLCDVLDALNKDWLMGWGVWGEMKTRIESALGDREWLAKKGEWKPRVAIARKFAEQARNNS